MHEPEFVVKQLDIAEPEARLIGSPGARLRTAADGGTSSLPAMSVVARTAAMATCAALWRMVVRTDHRVVYVSSRFRASPIASPLEKACRNGCRF
jgi:hypothetical protein